MSRIASTLAELMSANKTALVPYVTAGDPHPNMTVELMHLLVEQGANMIELGVPFSDPMADGPVIQKAVERALAHQVTLRDVLAMVKRFRTENDVTPVILMGYLNPVEAMGYETFAQAAAEAGVDGVLTVDMPPEESTGYLQAIKDTGLDRVFMVSPTTPDNRLAAVNEQGSGFVYYVSLKGVTGSKALDVADVNQHVEALKQHTQLPIGIGFGIRNGEAAYNMAKIGNAVIVGSALVTILETHADSDKAQMMAAITEKMTEFKEAIDQADSEAA